jgi:hypothetical protein
MPIENPSSFSITPHSRARAIGQDGEDTSRIDGVLESSMPFFPAEQKSRKSFESKVRCVGMCEGQDLLDVEIGNGAEACVDVTLEKTSLEVGLVGYQQPTGQQLTNIIAHHRKRWLGSNILIDDSGESTDERRHAPSRTKERTGYASRPFIRVEKQDPDLENFRRATGR